MAKKITIRMGGYGPPTTTHSRGLKYIGDELTKKFGDSLEIKYIWNVMELGYGSDAVLWLTECGMLDLVYMSTTALTARVPDLEFVDLPFLFPDNKSAREAYDGELGTNMCLAVEEKCNFLVLGYFENGFRHLSNRLRTVSSPEDLSGMSIRTLGSEMHNRTFELLNMSPKSMRLDEAKISIANHEVDAQENPFANTMTYGIHKIHKFHTLSSHFYLSRGLFANPQKHASWPSEIRDELKSIIKTAVVYQRELAVNEESIARTEIENSGGSVYELNLAEKKAFKDSLTPIYEEARKRFNQSMFSSVGW
jgi:TRAP-type C4-dicarboxylate transport system substrate-binding protein|tara:strand:- start:735 stop:1658 length:924 start_codon:yes stop_codon:yes gene_type:complete